MKTIVVFIILITAGYGLFQYFSPNPKDGLRDNNIVKLTLWNMPPKSLPLDRQIWDETVSRFEQENPDIKIIGVEREYQPEEFVTVMAGGKGPDLVKVWVGSIQTLANLGFLEPMDRFMQNWNQKDYIKPVLMDSTKVGDYHYGVPADSYFLFLLYRKDLFKKAGLNPDNPPGTWEEWIADARALTHRLQGEYGLGLTPKTWYFQDFVWQAGGEMVKTVSNGQVVADFGEPPAVTALKFWKDLRWKYNVLQPDVLMPESELLHLFALGKVAMILGTENQLPALITRYKIDPQSFGIAPLPAGPKGRAAHMSGDVYIINAATTPEKKNAAWKWIAFEMGPANQFWKWNRMHDLNMPIYPGAFSSASDVEHVADFKRVEDSIDAARVEPHVKGWPQVRNLLDEEPLQEIFLDPEADPQALLQTFAKEADQEILANTN